MNRDIRLNRPGAGAVSPSRSPRNNYDDRRDNSASSGRYNSQDQRRPNREPEPDSRSGYGGRGDQRRPMESGRRYGETLSTGSNTSTNSSSGSSLLDRMKVKSYETSARTSFEDDYDTPKQSGGWARKPTSLRTQKHAEDDEYEPAADANSAGNTIWGRVVAAAGSLTINVSKAWDNGINLQDGEETPPGGESRLTKVMKAYYIERARSPEDLPEWLFDDFERRPMAAPGRHGRNDREEIPPARGNRHNNRDNEPPPRTQNRGALRDVYDRAATQAPSRLAPTSYSRNETASDAGTAPSKAASRLRAMRDAKRGHGAGGPVSPISATGRFPDDNAGYDGGRRSIEPANDMEQRPPRMGLPRRPGGNRY